MAVELEHFRLAPYSAVSFSGGRTSGYMLYHILQAHEGKLPDLAHVLFFNTGKEREETYQFVRECGERWGVRIRWLEYDRVPYGNVPADADAVFQDASPRWRQIAKEVTFETANRNGEPFAKLIAARSYLPNVVTRYCTSEMKVRTAKRFLLAQGWEHWDSIVGIRADEPGRLGRIEKERWTRRHPLANAGVTEEDVMAFWASQPFDLKLKQYEGNCDLCFLKGRQKKLTILSENPRLAGWWIDQEDAMRARIGTTALGQFDKRRSVRDLLNEAQGGPMFNNNTFNIADEPVEDCHCTD